MPNAYLPPVITIPSALEIIAISQSLPMSITTSADSDQMNVYIPGQTIRLTVPFNYGMYQANGLMGQIQSVTAPSMTVNIDSSGFDPFVVPSSGEQPASLAPAGSQNLQYMNGTNFSVPFQSLNNIGN